MLAQIVNSEELGKERNCRAIERKYCDSRSGNVYEYKDGLIDKIIYIYFQEQKQIDENIILSIVNDIDSRVLSSIDNKKMGDNISGFIQSYSYIKNKYETNIEVVKEMIERKDQEKQAIINKLEINNAKFLSSPMAKYMKSTIREDNSYENIIEKLSELPIPLSYDVDEGRNL